MSFANWWSRLTGVECAECGQPVPAFARTCGYCGAANRLRAAAIAVAAALAVLAIAAVVAIVVVASWQRLPIDATTQSPPAGGDFAWLTNAMQECDTLAEKEPETLHFLVIPLAVATKDEDWQAKALNKIGNGILLRSDVALDGLKGGALSIAKEGYILSVRDQAQVTYNWDRTVGVAKFSIPNGGSIDGFNIQFQYRDKQGGDDWGNAFARKKGNCYWVNVILAS